MVANQYVMNSSIVGPYRQRPLPPSEPVAAFAKFGLGVAPIWRTPYR